MKRVVLMLLIVMLGSTPAGCESGMEDADWGEGALNAWEPSLAGGGNLTTNTSIRDLGEPCNGLDDNANGMVDEGCPCWVGTYQKCYSGPVQTLNVGTCIEGGQRCVRNGGVIQWGKCMEEVTPGKEIDDGWDNDCDGLSDEGWGCNPGPLMIAEDCTNGTDDDCDGFADCNDSDCCGKSACASSPACVNLSCCVPGTERWCDAPLYCSWGRQTCLPDGQWGQCEEATPPASLPAGCTDSGFFNLTCCVAGGLCCQNYPIDGTSVGSCVGIVTACPE